MKSGLWWMGKIVQGAALLQVAYALYVGLATANAHNELEQLLLGAGIFAVGLFLEKLSGGGQAS